MHQQKAEKRLQGILKRARASGITSAEITQEIQKYTLLTSNNNQAKPGNLHHKYGVFGIVVLIAILYLGRYLIDFNSDCLIAFPFDTTKVFRPPEEDCRLCVGVRSIARVHNISERDFEEIYARPARPLIVADGTRDWSATQVFDFAFFRRLYGGGGGGKKTCQFFPYKTEFKSLRDALNMSAERAQLAEGTLPWYIGWSNCNDAAGRVLRRHYKRPYFLPASSENMALSWIFMGGPGEGAHMHVDNVRYASWQAQLRGRKKWRLAPPPECQYVCGEFEAIVEPGEIIVVDTNRWYHQTFIQSGDISITIGTEFD